MTGSAVPDLKVRRMVVEGGAIWLYAESPADSAICPSCGAVSRSVHDRYVRRPSGVPWGGHVVRFAVTVRSFRCDNPNCARATFAEEFGAALPGRARRTREATEYLLHFARTAGAEAGARLAAAAGLATSPDTLLRLQHSIENEGSESAVGRKKNRCRKERTAAGNERLAEG